MFNKNPNRKYQYRNFRCNVVEETKLWCVEGGDLVDGGGGVLEWCCDEEDAKECLAKMEATGEFQGLQALPYSKLCDKDPYFDIDAY